jgi:hypothetical protein
MKNQNIMDGIITCWANVFASEFEIDGEAFKK